MKYDVFISYRRKGGYETAKHLNDLLVRDGYRVSFDIDTLRSGNFDTQLYERIDQCADFVLIVDQHAFDRTLDPTFDPKNDWLRCELAYALKKQKNIIPVFLAGATGFPEGLPADIQEVVKKNGPEYNKYHFNNFYEVLKKRFLHRPPLYRQKKVLLSAALLLLVLISSLFLYGVVRSIHKDDPDKATSESIEETLPDYKYLVREKFENTPDLDATDRADIVDVIKTFVKNTDKNTCNSWSVFSDFTKSHDLIPLSQGVESESDSAILPYRLDYIAKLSYKGKNLDSDIHGNSKIQEIYLGGPRMGPFLLVISSGLGASYDLGDKAYDIVEEAGFSRRKSSLRYAGITYSISYNKKGCILVTTCSGGSGGDFYEWIVSYDQDLIVRYLDNGDIFNSDSLDPELLTWYETE